MYVQKMFAELRSCGYSRCIIILFISVILCTSVCRLVEGLTSDRSVYDAKWTGCFNTQLCLHLSEESQREQTRYQTDHRHMLPHR